MERKNKKKIGKRRLRIDERERTQKRKRKAKWKNDIAQKKEKGLRDRESDHLLIASLAD